MEVILIFFSQVTFCVFKTLIIYTTMNGEKSKTAGIAVILGVINLGVVFIGIKAIEQNNMSIILAYLAGNFVGTYFSTRSKDENNTDESNRHQPFND